MIPSLDPKTGYLPPGVHDATTAEVRASFCLTVYRERLFSSFELVVLRPFFAAGIDEMFVAGSFCSAAPMPNDIDAFWTYKAGFDPSRVDPVLLDMNTFVRDPSSGKRVRPMKLKYGIELFMDHPGGMINGRSIHNFFSESRDGTPRGILRFLRSSNP